MNYKRLFIENGITFITFVTSKRRNIPKNWKYSSFEKCVKNGFYDLDWCNFEDKNNIKEMYLE